MAKTLGSLAVGAKIKFGKHQIADETPWDIVWTVVAKNHYHGNSVTLQSERVIDLRCFDAKEPDSTQNDAYVYAGNSQYSLSNIRQWLNSKASAGAWYSAQHDCDRAPDSSSLVDNGTEYASRPGFLKNFTSDEYNAILTTGLSARKPASEGGSLAVISDRVFLPSLTEIGVPNENGAEGTTWAYYSDGGSRKAVAHPNVYQYSPCPEVTLLMTTGGAPWWTRSAKSSGAVHYVSETGDAGSTKYPRTGSIGVRPALSLVNSKYVSDTTDGDDCYTLVYNSAPGTPGAFGLSGIPQAGKGLQITWGASIDVDGDLAGYILQRSYDGGSYKEVIRTTSTAYTDTIAEGKETVAYRVYAYDSTGLQSSARTSTTYDIISNVSPAVSSAESTNLGTKSEGFTLSYSVEDADNESVTVVEKVDSVVFNTYTVSNGNKSSEMSITGEAWLKLSNGSHTITITATDAKGGTGSKTFNFTKSVTKLIVKNSTPYDADVMPTRIRLDIGRGIADGATFKVYVCNNGYDSQPTWEDATSAVESNRVYSFTNFIKSAAAWGVIVKVEVDRGSASGVSYVSQIGGNFE